jgi:hypothetical protein
MSRMIELIQQSAVPAHLMKSAAHGALSLPAAETLEILVFLTGHSIFGERAQLTLAGWSEASLLEAARDAQTPPTVLDYLSAPAHIRPSLAPALLENPSVPDARLMELAQSVSREGLSHVLASSRVRANAEILRSLLVRPDLKDEERRQLESELQNMGALITDAPGQQVLEPELSQYLEAHAGEIAAEEGKPFRLIDWTVEEQAEISAVVPEAAHAAANPGMVAARAMGLAAKSDPERISPVQKIAKMSVGERVNLAYRGNRDERSILIRDGARLVSAAVLESPKITESEVESFAGMRNVGENVPRTIATKRKWMRSYALKRILTANPRCPTDVVLPMIKELLLADLKRLMGNKNVSDTVRNFAMKTFKEKQQRDK